MRVVIKKPHHIADIFIIAPVDLQFFSFLNTETLLLFIRRQLAFSQFLFLWVCISAIRRPLNIPYRRFSRFCHLGSFLGISELPTQISSYPLKYHSCRSRHPDTYALPTKTSKQNVILCIGSVYFPNPFYSTPTNFGFALNLKLTKLL